MGGYKRGNEAIYITHLPDRKRPCLAIGNGCVIHKIATFDTEEEAEAFYQMLGAWLGCGAEMEGE